MKPRIRGKELELSPRRAVDALKLAAAAEKLEAPDNLTKSLQMVQVVSDSLKATGMSLGRMRGWRYRPFFSVRGLRFILRDLTSAEILEAYLEVMALEGLKKKVEETLANLSGRDVAKGLIAAEFGIPLDEVEERSIVEYRLMLFTVFNIAALRSGMGGFQYQTEDEAVDQLEREIEFFRRKGTFRG